MYRNYEDPMQKQCHEWWQQTQDPRIELHHTTHPGTETGFEQYLSSETTKDGNKLVDDSNNFIVVVIPRAVGNSTNCYLS